MVCAECDREAKGDAAAWRGYRTDDPTLDEMPALAFYCPECAAEQFGPLLPRGSEGSSAG
jgi:hypothetical protein